MRLGIGSYTYTWAIGVPGNMPARPMSVLDLMCEARRLRLNVLQFCDNLPLTSLTASERQSVEELARQLQLEIEVGTRGLEPENLRANLRVAQQFRCPFLRVVIDSPGDEPTPDQVVQRLRPLLPEFAAAGVRLAIENHDRFTCETLIGIVRALGTDQVGICLDTVNSFGALEGPATVVESLAGHALNLHIKDFTVSRVRCQMGFEISGCPAGQGRLDVPSLLDKLRRARREVNAILELWTPYGPTLDETIERERQWAEQSVTYLRGLIPK